MLDESLDDNESTARLVAVLIVNVDPEIDVVRLVPPCTVNVDPILKSCDPESAATVRAL